MKKSPIDDMRSRLNKLEKTKVHYAKQEAKLIKKRKKVVPGKKLKLTRIIEKLHDEIVKIDMILMSIRFQLNKLSDILHPKMLTRTLMDA